MRRVISFFVAGLFVVATSTPLVAQSKADEKELAAYTLTLPTLKKVVAAMRAMSQEMMNDPKYQQLMKFDEQIEALEKELEPLQAKDEPTEADEAKMESLLEQIEKARERKEQAEEAMSTDSPGMNNAQTLDDMERAFAQIGPMARALKREGLSPREYAKFTMAMLQAGMIHGFSQGKVDYAKLPAGVNPANVKFIAEHKAELDAMQQEFAAMGKRKRN
jgi:predicted RNase H-like nuclease (RuvC/YqgF family)